MNMKYVNIPIQEVKELITEYLRQDDDSKVRQSPVVAREAERIVMLLLKTEREDKCIDVDVVALRTASNLACDVWSKRIDRMIKSPVDPEYFDFEPYTDSNILAFSTYSTRAPFFVLVGLAEDGFKYKEVLLDYGWSVETRLHRDGKRTVLRIKKSSQHE